MDQAPSPNNLAVASGVTEADGAPSTGGDPASVHVHCDACDSTYTRHQHAVRVGEYWRVDLREQSLDQLRQSLPKLLDRNCKSKQVLMDVYMAVHQMVSRRFGSECYEYVSEALAGYARQMVNPAVNLLDDLFRLSALYDESLQDAKAACQYMERHYDAMDLQNFYDDAYKPVNYDDPVGKPKEAHYKPVIDVGRRAFREAVVEYVKENKVVRDRWLEAAEAELQAGTMPSDPVKQNRKLLTDAFENSPDFYYEHFERPFIRACVAYYHDKAKNFAEDVDLSQYEETTNEWIRVETERAEVFLLEPHRSDYLTTLAELFDLGTEKFQSPS
ncbi:Cullin [Aphelenchoides avenae]|nr:Cullin [Aphelenchus avenae]